VVAGLGCLLLLAGPVSVAASQRALDGGTRAFKAGDCAVATDRALDSLDALGVRPEPFELLGYCNLRGGREELAVDAFESARARDPEDWQYAYGLAVAQALAGEDPRAMARLARRLNPRDARARELAAALRGGGPRRWARAAARARVPFQ
jgi:Flp pilus assembly protein TadD